jgi:two-component system, NarL family, nitrate/nitrite response regulator NarL
MPKLFPIMPSDDNYFSVARGKVMITKPVSIALLEDLDVVAEGLRSWVDGDPDHRAMVAAVANSVADMLAGPGRDADVLVLDLELDGQVVAELSDAGHRVIAFSAQPKPYLVRAVLDAGACAFLDMRTERDHFIDTVVAVAHDQQFVTPSMAGDLPRGVRLSGRESQTLRLMFQGMDYASIASRLKKPTGESISALTVKEYVERARAKFAAAGRPCRSNFALLARCIEDGLVRPEEIDDYRPTGSALGCPPNRGRARAHRGGAS